MISLHRVPASYQLLAPTRKAANRPVQHMARRMPDDGFNPMRVLELCREAMDVVGAR